ncbi:MAG TPA: dioxygenase [Dongiaceae bacterium]|nr:dioxygenase [Dongiaceae bacterium]
MTRSQEAFTATVVNATADDADPRIKEVLSSLIRNLHNFVQEVGLTLDEFVAGCQFLARAGKMSNETRNEFILIANILGIEVLIDRISPQGGEQTTVLGPMHRADAPRYANGSSIVLTESKDAETIFLEGYVRDARGAPIPGATVDVWQAGANGLYDVQDPAQDDLNLRGLFTTDAEGYYSLICVRPAGYPIPDDGPGGDLLRMTKRHPMRPAHIHFIVSAPGKNPIVSQLYDASCKYIDNDSIFAVKDQIIVDFEPAGGRSKTDLYLQYDWKLSEAK